MYTRFARSQEGLSGRLLESGVTVIVIPVQSMEGLHASSLLEAGLNDETPKVSHRFLRDLLARERSAVWQESSDTIFPQVMIYPELEQEPFNSSPSPPFTL
jgi:hypothetical protein